MSTAKVAGVEVDARHWIGGRRVGSDRTFTDVSPVDESPIAEIARGSEAEVDAAVRAARKAFEGWATTAPEQRAAVLNAIADGIDRRVEELAQVETWDNGALLRSHRRGVMPRAAMNFRFFADWLGRLSAGDLEISGHREQVSWAPSGVTAVITPWNAPLMLATWRIAPALAAGNTVVAKLPAAPTYFHKPVSALVGHGGAVIRPANCRYLNYEGEVAIVIGRTCRNVPPSRAGEYIAGYTIGNDFGLHDFRDTDAGSMLRVKGSDTMAPLGPGLVTGWDFRGKRLRTYVNGRLAQDGSTDEMKWDMHYLVADIARTITLVPGDVLLSGTPAGSRPVQPGDVVDVEVDGLGRLTNHVVAGPEAVAAEYGAQPSESEEVVSTALGGDWEFRGIRPPIRA